PRHGHSEAASGITSLIKAVLALENRTIPPSIKFLTPNPKIPFKEANLKVPVEPMSWLVDRAERVSVNSFGIGGANAHVILDSASSLLGAGARKCTEATTARVASTLHLIVLSANTSESLRRRVTDVQNFLTSYSDMAGDTAHTLGPRRKHLTYRALGFVFNKDTVEFSHFQKMLRIAPAMNFVFTGQEAQW
ncbi:putative polyketide synthase, partial [Setomelanomma holmii]